MDSTAVAKIDNFFSSFPLRKYPANQILIFANEDPEHVYYVKSGSVKVYYISYRGDEIIVNLYKHPAFFPMAWILNRSENKFFYSTESQSELYVAPLEDTFQFIRNNQDVTFDLVQRVYRGTDGLLERLVHLMSGSARDRLIYEIVLDCMRFAKNVAEDQYILSTNELGLASRTGLSRETVSREMHRLKDRKLVTITGSSVIIRRFSELKKLLPEI